MTTFPATTLPATTASAMPAPAPRPRRPARLGLAGLVLVSMTALGACTAGDALDLRGEQPVPRHLLRAMKSRDMEASAPVLMRIFKEESELEVWKKTRSGRYAKLRTYEICKWSGELGPKLKEGDRQAPEGFYFVNRGLMNPNSDFYLSFNLGFPNRFDRSHGRTGSYLMVHGACSSAGCYAMEDDQIAEIYAMARDALRGGQERFQVQAFPFRMTPENMARHRDSEHFAFWENLRVGYDHFELTKLPPKVDVCERSYQINRNPVGGGTFVPNAACPESVTPEALAKVYADYQSGYALKFEREVRKLGGKVGAPSVQDAGDALEGANVPEGVTVEPLATN